MTTAPLSAATRIRSAAARSRAVAGSILGSVAVLAIAGAALLVVPVAAALAFGPALLAGLG